MYLRETPVGFELGMTFENKIWRIPFNLEKQTWTHLGITYTEKKGTLCLVIDGVSQERQHCARSKDRIGFTYYPDKLDPISNLYFTTCPGEVDESACNRVQNVTFWDNYHDYEKIYSHAEKKQFLSVYYQGCVVDKDTLRDSEMRDDAVDCRITCAAKSSIAMFNPASLECACVNEVRPARLFNRTETDCTPFPFCENDYHLTCKGEGAWQVFGARSYQPLVNPLEALTVEDMTEPGRNEKTTFIRVNGSESIRDIKFTLKMGSTEIVTYRRLIEFQRPKDNGVFQVTVKAEYMDWTEMRRKKILIRPYIQPVEVGLSVATTKPPIMKASFQIATVSGGKTVCVVQYGDGNMKKQLFRSRNSTQYMYLSKNFGKPNNYVSAVTCMNKNGHAATSELFTVDNTRHDIEYDERALEFTKSDTVEAPVNYTAPVLYVRDEPQVGLQPINDRYQLQKKELYCLGALPVTEEDDYGIASQTVYHVQNRLTVLKMTIRNPHLKPNETMQLEIECQAADEAPGVVDLFIDFGDGTTKYFQGQLSLFGVISHTFAKPGMFDIKMEAVNYISKLQRAVKAFVEKPIGEVAFYGSNVTFTSIPVVFTVQIPAVKLKVSVIFGDGEEVTYTVDRRTSDLAKENHDGNLLEKKISRGGMFLKVQHKYQEYRVFHAKLIVANNVSKTEMSDVIQIGEAVNQTFLEADKTLFSVSEPVSLILTILGGAPVDIDIQKGDGTSAVVSIDQGRGDRAVEVRAGQIRSWVISNYQYGFEFSYDSPGTYQVMATVGNSYAHVQGALCPSLIVVPDYTEVQCSFGFLESDLITSRNVPKRILRSQAVTVDFISELNCNDDTFKRPLTFSYQAYDLQFEADGKPPAAMDKACGKEFQEHQLVIPPRTLPIGSYEVSIEIDVPDLTGVNEHRKIWLDVSQSPLLAHIKGGEDGYVYKSENDTYLIDLFTDSHDPDVDLYNLTNVLYGMWCMIEQDQPTVFNVTGTLIYEDQYVTFRDVDGCFYENITELMRVDNGKFYFPLAAFTTEDPIFRVTIRKEGRDAWFDQKLHIRATRPLSGSLKRLAAAAGLLEQAQQGDQKSKLLNEMVGLLDDSVNEINTVDTLELTSSILNVVTNDADVITVDNQAKATNSADAMAGTINKLKTSDKKSMQVASDLLNSMSSMIAKAVDKDAESFSKADAREPEKVKTLDEQIKSFESDPYDGFFLPEERISLQPIWDKETKRKKAKVSKGSLKATDGVADAMIGRKKAENEKVTNVESGGIQLQLKKDEPGKTGENDTVMVNPKASISVPKGLVKGSKDKTICTKFMVSESNPFGFDEGSKAIQSPVISLKYEDDEGQEIPVNDAKEPISMFIATKAGIPPKRHFKFIPKAAKMNYHSVKVFYPNSSVHITFLPDEQRAHTFEVFVKLGGYPTMEDHDFNFTLPSVQMQMQLLSETAFNTSSLNETDQEDLLNTYMIPSNEVDVGTYYIGVIPEGFRFNDSMANMTEEDISLLWDTGYDLRLFTSGCRYWNEEQAGWDTEGCVVGPLTTASRTQCLCTHLTMFGADFYVPPNMINFNTVFQKFAKLGENAGVFSFVFVVLGLYMLGAIWGRRKDKRDIDKWSSLPLSDNIATDRYNYLIEIHTSMKRNSGTKSKVSAVITGELADTGVRVIDDGVRKDVFKTGTVTTFVMSTATCLGPLTYLRVWHDNSGKGNYRSWHLSHIVLTDIQTNQRYLFIGNSWLAVEEGDGKIDRLLPVSDPNDTSNASYLFNLSMRKKLTNDHIWLSVLWRPQKSHFTRVQRISCCVSLLFCTMIANAMFYRSSDDKAEADSGTSSTIQMGPFRFSAKQLYISIISTLVVFPANLLQVHLFRRARPAPQAKKFGKFERKERWIMKDKPEVWNKAQKSSKMANFYKSVTQSVGSIINEEKSRGSKKKSDKKKKNTGLMPHWVIYIAWASVALSIAGSAFFTILYSLEWGKEKAEEWLSTMLLSLIQSILFVQPIKIVMIALFVSFLLRKPSEQDVDEVDDEDEIKNAIAGSDDVLMNREIQLKAEAMRKRRAKQAALKPLVGTALDKAREYRLKELQMEQIIRDMIVYIIYLLILMFLAYQSRDVASFRLTSNIKETLLYSSSGGPSFMEIKSQEDLKTWLKTHFLAHIYSGPWYDGGEMSWRERLTDQTRVDLRMGPPRLRTLRHKTSHECMLNFSHCWKHGLNSRDEGKYGVGWTKLDPDSDEFHANDTKSPWVYQSSFELKAVPFPAKRNTYPGNGYATSLSRSLFKGKQMIDHLVENNWIDNRTEAVLIEFTIYNPNVNLFSTSIVCAEFTELGMVIPYAVVKVFRLFSYLGGFGLFVLLAELSFVGFIIYYTGDVIREIRRQGSGYFNSFWNGLEFATAFLRAVLVAMYILKKLVANHIIKEVVAHEYDTYINFTNLAYWDELFGMFMAFLVFLATVRFTRLLRFNRRMSMLGSTIRLVGQKNSAFITIIAMNVCAFGFSGMLIFGGHLEGYSSFVNGMLSLFNFILGTFDFEIMQQVNFFLGPLFFFAFAATMVVLVAGIFMTVVNESITAVREDVTNQSNDYEMVEFIMTRFKTYLKVVQSTVGITAKG